MADAAESHPDGHDDPLDAAYRRLAADPASGPDFADAVLAARREIIGVAGRRHRPDREAAKDALVDEVLRILAGTSKYDRSKLGLTAYLRMAVRRKGSNARRDAGRRRRRETLSLERHGRSGDVAADPPVGNDLAEVEIEEARLAEARTLLGERDCRFLLAVRSGATRAELAEVLGPDAGDPGPAVKRAVDRIRVKLKRGGILP